MLTITPLHATRSLRTLAFRSHRVAMAAWGVGVGAVAWWFGTVYQETISGPGGAKAFAALAQPTAEAMRPLTGPASRLDTYGGYFTYHNMGYFVLFLAIYGAIQGARAVRGDEEQGLADMWLAMGRPRWTIVRDRLIGFVASLAVIGLLLSVGSGLSTVAAGQPNWGGAFISVGETLLVCLFGFGFGLLVSSFLISPRSAAAVSSLVIVGFYVLNNMAEQVGLFSVLRWLTPFAYYEQSRALIPGVGFALLPTLLLALLSAGLITAGALAYVRRDSDDTLQKRPVKRLQPPLTRVKLGRLSLRDIWAASLSDQKVALAGWISAAAVLQWLYVAVGEGVLQEWSNNPLIERLFLARAGASLEERYISFTVIMTVGIGAAFVIWEATRWLRDQRQRRVEMALAHGVSRSRLVVERAFGVTTATLGIGIGGAAGTAFGALTSNMAVSWTGLGRTVAAMLLLCMAVSGISLLAVSVLRSGIAIGVLTIWLAASWVMTLFAGMAHFPDWLLRLSLFDAFGDPYVTPLRTGSVIYMAALAVAGAVIAATVATGTRDDVY